MTPERWKQVEEIFNSALEHGAGERSAFLARACAGDEGLLSEVEKLLSSYELAGSFIEEPPFKVPTTMQVEHSTESLAGRAIGHYKVLGLLGSGGMGDVYLAQDTRLHRKVALKMLPAAFTQDASRLRRFEQEARAISALNHPNIVTIYEVGEVEAGRFIAIEFIEGRTLRSINENGRLSPDSLMQVCGQMAKALRVAHAAGIVHRDIKPENIMVRPDGYVKVLDFGLARLVPRKDMHIGVEDETRRYDSLIERQPFEAATDPGIIIGTMRYMSPEQARGKPTDTATDIFSLGIVFYELATGHHPFMADSPIGVMNAILSQSPLSPARLHPEINPAFEALILRMLEKEPMLRPTAAEVDALLAGLTDGSLKINTEARLAAGAKRHTVGHEAERAELRSCFESIDSGVGLLVCVTGEPGIGKTTLIEDFINEMQTSGRSSSCIVARGRCSERLAGSEAYLPFLEVLDSLLRGEAGEQAARIMRLVAPTWYVHVAPVSDNDSSAERLMTDIKTASQERMKRELCALLHELSQIKPVVIFIDDLHWADVSTVDILAYLAGKFEGTRVLIVTTYRSPDLLLAKHPFLQLKRDLQARGLCHQIMLQFLTREDVERYLALEFPKHRFPAELPALIHSKTEGSPLFMVDMVRYLRDRKVIAAAPEDIWQLAESLPDMERELPQSIRSMIQRKLDQLDGEDFRLLVAASVQGYEFDSAVISEALGIDPAEVEERLEILDRVHYFVQLIGEKEFPDRTLTLRYRFVHVLYQNALYASLQPTRRVTLSRAVAESLREHYGEQEAAVAARLAILFEAARDFKRAAQYFLLAAQHAAQVFANQEAVTLARRGLDLLKLLPDTPERTHQELMFHVTMGVPLMATRGYAMAEVEENYTHARSLCEQLGVNSDLFPVLSGLWLIYMVREELGKAQELAEQLVELAESCDDPALKVESCAMLAAPLTHSGRFEEALEQLEKGSALYREMPHHVAYSGHDPGMICLSFGGWVLWSLGYPDRALEKVNEALALAQQLSHPQTLALALFMSSFIHYMRREFAESQRQSEASIAVSREHGLPQTLAWGRSHHGLAVAAQGQGEQALVQARESIDAQRAMGAELARPNFLSMIAEGLGKYGRVDEGLNAVREALDIAERTGERAKEAEFHRVKGELLLKKAGLPSGPLDAGETVAATAQEQLITEAEESFLQAIRLAQSQKARSWELRATVSLCRLWQRRGKSQEAREMLSQIYGWFTEGFETADLQEAHALLKELS